MLINGLNMGLITVALTTLLSALILAYFAQDMKLLAHPGEHRLHRVATPMVGGIAIYLGILAGFVLIDGSFALLLPALLFLCLVGVADDRYKLPSWSRFLAQSIAIYAMIKLTGVKLTTLGYLTPNSEVLLGSWSTPMTLFAVIGVINAVNMSDGHDGLAGSLILVVLLGLLYAGADTGIVQISIAAIVGFLVLNLRVFRPRAKIFMGDAGSTMLGLLLAYLLIKHSQVTSGIWPVTALWLLALPLIDAVAVLIVRPLRGQSPFSADRIHYHHQLVDRGVSINAAVIVAVLIQSGFIVFGLWAWKVGVAGHLQLIAFLIIFACYLGSLLWFTRTGRPSQNLDL